MPQLKEPQHIATLECIVVDARTHTAANKFYSHLQRKPEQVNTMELDVKSIEVPEDTAPAVPAATRKILFNGSANIDAGDKVRVYIDTTNWTGEGFHHSALTNVSAGKYARSGGFRPEETAFKMEKLRDGRVIHTYTNGPHT